MDELHVMIRKANAAAQHSAVNERFHQFGSFLFSSCVDFERSIQTRDVNDRLDQVIRCFLIEISAYLYMKPTSVSPPHKALEWLVYRFYFHRSELQFFSAVTLCLITTAQMLVLTNYVTTLHNFRNIKCQSQ